MINCSNRQKATGIVNAYGFNSSDFIVSKG